MSASTATGERNKHSKLSQEKLDISKEEFERIREALGKEEFRKLFFDYVEEIQDPENRKIYENEIAQLEKERGVEVTFIHPKPGFVVKTAIEGELKCFINIASCAEVARPENVVAQDPETGARGITWSIPMAQTPGRDDFDSKNNHCKVYDVVFHPDALYLAQRNPEFRKCLIDTALDAIEREYKVSLDRANLKFPKLDYKGVSRPTVIRKLSKNATEEEREPHPLEHMYPQKPDAANDEPKILPLKTKPTPKPKYTIPKYIIKQSHDVDLSEYTDELDAKLNLTVPRSLVVEIELPLLRSTAECQLDVTNNSIYLLSERQGAKYKLKLDLPYTVNDKAGNARFDTDKRRLCITLPVARSSAKKEREMHDTLRQLNREDSGVELHSNSESPVEEEDDDVDGDAEAEQSDSTDEPTKTVTSDQSDATTATTTQSPRSFLKSSVHYQLPAKFDCNVLDNVMAFVLHVPNVQPDSLLTLQQPQSLHLQFATVGSGFYPTYYAFFVKLPSDAPANLRIETSEPEAWDNNIVLKVTLSTKGDGLKTYLAGLDENDLVEYSVHGQYPTKTSNMKKKCEEGEQKFNITVDRNDDEPSLEITITPKHSAAACASNTTEDEEHNDQQQKDQQLQKKVNKKQRKRNKKQRSLSESACEDINKVYDAQQQAANKQPAEPHEHSSPERSDDATASKPVALLKVPPRKQRSYSECNESSVGSGGSVACRGILKRFSRYGPRPSISDSCSSIDECSSSFSCSVDAAGGLGSYSQSFGGIPEERDDPGLSESCKKTVRFNDQIMKQVFRLDSSILGRKKKNQKRRDCKMRAQQRRVSEGDSVDYEDNNTTLKAAAKEQYFKQSKEEQDLHDSGLDLVGAQNNNNSDNNDNEAKRNKKPRAEHEQYADAKNSMIFEMDDDM